MSLHINRFIDRLRGAENRQQKDFIMTLSEARDLHGDITKLLLLVQGLREQPPQTDAVQTVEIDGGSF